MKLFDIYITFRRVSSNSRHNTRSSAVSIQPPPATFFKSSVTEQEDTGFRTSSRLLNADREAIVLRCFMLKWHLFESWKWSIVFCHSLFENSQNIKRRKYIIEIIAPVPYLHSTNNRGKNKKTRIVSKTNFMWFNQALYFKWNDIKQSLKCSKSYLLKAN